MVEVATLSFDEQVAALVERGVGGDEAELRAKAESARLPEWPERSVLTPSRELVPPATAAARIERRGRPLGLGQLEPEDLEGFVPIAAVELPEAPAYVAIELGPLALRC